MKRVILDTSVYGKLVEEPEVADIILQRTPKEFVIYGNGIIKKELRDTPKHVFHSGKNVRNLLLSLYRSFVRKDHHDLDFNKLIETLSKDYMKTYRESGGSLSNEKMKNDLIIIATATIYGLDIVVSDDENSMMSTPAIDAYLAVNRIYGMPNPSFRKYRHFKAELLRPKNQGDLPL